MKLLSLFMMAFLAFALSALGLNDTNTSLTSISDDDPTVYLSIGQQPVNVGDLGGSDLYGAVWQGLNSICPPDASACTSGTAAVVEINYWQGSKVVRGRVFRILATLSHYDNNALRRLLIGSVAGVAQKASEDAKNCYAFRWGKNGRYPARHCNIPSVVNVGARDNVMNVYFQSQGTSRRVDCIAILEATGKYIDTLLPEWATELGVSDAPKDLSCLDHSEQALLLPEVTVTVNFPITSKSTSLPSA